MRLSSTSSSFGQWKLRASMAGITLVAAPVSLQAAIALSFNAAGITQLKALGLTGAGVVTGQIESFQPDMTHLLLAGTTLGGQFGTPDTLPDNHSTQVAGIMVGGANGGQMGVAPGATHYSAGWDPVNIASPGDFTAPVDYMVTAPLADIVNMSAGDTLNSRTPVLSRVADWAAVTHNTLFVVACTNDGWNNTTNAPRPNSTGNPDGGYNVLSVGALGGVVGARTGTTNYGILAGFSGQGSDTDNPNNPDLVAPGGQISSSKAFWRDTDGLNGDLRDNNLDGSIQLDTAVLNEAFGYPRPNNLANSVQINGAIGSGNIADANANQVFDVGGDVVVNPGGNFDDNDADLRIGPGDNFVIGAVVAGDDVDDDYQTSNGTSFAAPHVSGASALLYQRATNNGAAQARDHKVMKSLLMNTTDHTVLDKQGKNWFNSPAYTNRNLVLDDQLGAGGLNANRARQHLDAGEFNGTTGINFAPGIGWDVNNGGVTQGEANSIWYDFDFLIPTLDTWLGATLNWDIPVARAEGPTTFTNGPLSNLDLFLWYAPDSFGRGGRSNLILSLSSTGSLINTELILANLSGLDGGYFSLEIRNLGDAGTNPVVPFGFAWYLGGSSGLGVPEPATLGLVVMGGWFLTRRARRSGRARGHGHV